jgi:hypothetical protein
MIRLALVLLLAGQTFSGAAPDATLREGDVVFQRSQSRQSEAVAIATRSQITHCGILVRVGTSLQVLEAVQPVKITPLKIWIARGRNGGWEAMRLRDAERVLTDSALVRMRAVGKGFVGRRYDTPFAWSDDEIYCSELVWKIFARGAGVRLTTPELLGSFNLSDPRLRSILQKRYGGKPPLTDSVISPKALHASSRFLRVAGNTKF